MTNVSANGVVRPRSGWDWTVGSAFAALMPLTPVFAFLIFIAAEVLADLLMEFGATAVCAVAAGAVGFGWVLFRKLWLRRHSSRVSEAKSAAFVGI